MKEKLNLLLQSLETRHSNPIDLSLKRIQEFKQKLCLDPKFKIITVAGTNGKGSVSLKLAKTLENQGFKTGLFTSPHINSFRERIQVDSKLISQENVLRHG